MAKKKHRILSDCIISGFLFVGKEILRVTSQFTYLLLFFCTPQLLLVTFTLWLNLSTDVFSGSFGVEAICFLKQSFPLRSPQMYTQAEIYSTTVWFYPYKI